MPSKLARNRSRYTRAKIAHGSGDKRPELKQGYPLRWNIIIIALLISSLSGGIMFLTYLVLSKDIEDENQFVIGALIGLLPTGITALVGLGTTLLNEKMQNKQTKQK